MINTFILVLLAVTVPTLYSSSGNRCSGGTISKPDNGNIVTWPITWNENQTAPHLAGNQNCQWSVSIPTGYYAKIVMSGKTGDNTSYFQLVDASGTIHQIEHETSQQAWYFPFPKFNININVNAPAKFAFQITWGASVTGISLLIIPANVTTEYTLRSALVFEGNDCYGRYVGSLYEIYKTHQPWTSNGQSIYIVNVDHTLALDQLLVQESGYVQGINPYKGLNCALYSTCSTSLNGGATKSGLVYLGYETQTLLDINMDAGATLSVYYGSPNSAGFYKSYNGNTIRSQLPLDFSTRNHVTQYIISSGKAMFTFKITY